MRIDDYVDYDASWAVRRKRLCSEKGFDVVQKGNPKMLDCTAKKPPLTLWYSIFIYQYLLLLRKLGPRP